MDIKSFTEIAKEFIYSVFKMPNPIIYLKSYPEYLKKYSKEQLIETSLNI